MAFQKSSLQIQGTIGNLTYFKSQDGYMVKAKSEVSKDKILSDPNFSRTRENMAEFGNAGKSGKTLRAPFNSLLQVASDSRMISRLTARCMNVIKTDTTSKRGKRTVEKGDLSLFNDFEFNNKGILSTALLAPFTVGFTKTTGVVLFDLPPFVPQQGIAAPQGATHYQLQLAAGPISFTAKKNKVLQQASAILPWDNTLSTDLTLTINLPANLTIPVFVLLQLQFTEELNGDHYQLRNGAFNACAIIGVFTS